MVLPDGSTRRGFVHRKGATRAFPAGHPDLAGTVWAQTGHPCLVPGSMLQGAAILFACEGAYRSGCSVNHGAGRVMGRGHAKRELAPRQDAIDAEMRHIRRTFGGAQIRGIVGSYIGARRSTSADTCSKDLDTCSASSRARASKRVAQRLYPA